jgi:hypothetical protein
MRMWRLEVYLHVFVVLVLDGNKWSALRLSYPFTSVKIR